MKMIRWALSGLALAAIAGALFAGWLASGQVFDWLSAASLCG